jgi:hypothetical protein
VGEKAGEHVGSETGPLSDSFFSLLLVVSINGMSSHILPKGS